MARLVLANKGFTEEQGQANKEWLPPYYQPPELDEQKKEFLKYNTKRIEEHDQYKSLPQLPPVPPACIEPPDIASVKTNPPHIQYVDNVEEVIIWSKPTFP